LAAPRVPEARLCVVGRGSRRRVIEELGRDLPGQTAWDEELSPPEVAQALDESTALVLPSRSEGLGRVLVEALCRARPVVATSVGGIRDVVEDGVNGFLVPPRDPQALAEALVRILTDRALAEHLAAEAHHSVEPWIATPDEYAERLRALVDKLAGSQGR